MNLEVKMEILHQRLNSHHNVKGSILLRDNGLHISSKIPSDMPEGRTLSAYLANVWRQLYRVNELEEGDFQLKDGTQIHLKHLPSKKIILTTFSKDADERRQKELLNHYSSAFLNIL